MSVHKEVEKKGYYYQLLQYQYTKTKGKERLISRSIEIMILSGDSQQRIRLRKKTTPGHLGSTGTGRAAVESEHIALIFENFHQASSLISYDTGVGVRAAAKDEGTTLCDGR